MPFVGKNRRLSHATLPRQRAGQLITVKNENMATLGLINAFTSLHNDVR